MNPFLVTLFLACMVKGEKPSIIFDNRPEAGVPSEALAQMHPKVSAKEGVPLAQGLPTTLYSLTNGKIKTIRIRYFNKKTWSNDEQVRAYVTGYLAHQSLDVFGFQVWAQSVLIPEIECLVDFTDEYRRKLISENKPCLEGRLLIWNTESCFRDASGKWWFVNAFDYFHKCHPKGKRELAKGANLK